MAADTNGSGAEPARAVQTLSWMQGLACGALITFEPATALALVVLLAPALVSAIAEAAPAKGVTRSVLLACIAAAMSPLWHLWLQGNRVDDALATLSQPLVLLLSWGAGATAWATCQVLPVILRILWDLKEAAREKSLRSELQRLRAEWELREPDSPSAATKKPG